MENEPGFAIPPKYAQQVKSFLEKVIVMQKWKNDFCNCTNELEKNHTALIESVHPYLVLHEKEMQVNTGYMELAREILDEKKEIHKVFYLFAACLDKLKAFDKPSAAKLEKLISGDPGVDRDILFRELNEGIDELVKDKEEIEKSFLAVNKKITQLLQKSKQLKD